MMGLRREDSPYIENEETNNSEPEKETADELQVHDDHLS